MESNSHVDAGKPWDVRWRRVRWRRGDPGDAKLPSLSRNHPTHSREHASMLADRHMWHRPGAALLAVAARLLLSMCILAGGSAAAASEALDLAIARLSRSLSHQIELKGRGDQRILVTARDFVEQETTRHVPLSDYLSTKFIEELRGRRMNPMLPGESEERAMVLQGNWQLFGERLHLHFWVRLPETEASNLPIATDSASVDVDGRLRRLLKHDLASLGNHVVKELQNRVSGFDREYRDLHVGEFSLKCMGGQEPTGAESLEEYLVRDWLAPALSARRFTGSRVFGLAAPGRRGDGALHVRAWVKPDGVEVSLAVYDNDDRPLSAVESVNLDREWLPSIGACPTAECQPLARLLGREVVPIRSHYRDNWTDLHFAAALNYPGCTNELLKQGAIGDSRLSGDGDGFSHELAAVLGAMDRDLGDWAKNMAQTPLHIASYFDSHQSLVALIDAGSNVESTTTGGATPLHYAARMDAYNAAEALIARGVNINTTAGASGQTALHYAAWYGSSNVARLLAESGAAVDVADRKGLTPLHYAAQTDELGVAAALVVNGATVNFRASRGGKTALHYAAWSGSHKVADLLAARGADLNILDDSGFAALHYAAYHGNLETARRLVRAGADVNVTNPSGLGPLQLAIEGNQDSIVRLLMDTGRIRHQ